MRASLSLRSQDDRQIETMPFPFDGDQHFVPGISRFDLRKKVVGILHRHTSNSHDQVGPAPIDAFCFGHEGPLPTPFPYHLEAPHDHTTVYCLHSSLLYRRDAAELAAAFLRDGRFPDPPGHTGTAHRQDR